MPLRVATFNAGLAVGVLPYATERLACVVDALASLDVDLLFVQEFWLDSHWEHLRRALEPEMPHTFRPMPTASPSRACTAEQLAPLVACAERHCAGLRDEALAQCVVASCAPVALALPTQCLNCIAARPEGSLAEVVGRCIGEEVDEETGAGGYSGLVAYGGSFGTGLLSREPLVDPSSIVFVSTVNARGAMHARVRDLHVFAAHLSPGGGEHPPQVERLLDWIDELAGNAPAVLLGDLNTTPGSGAFRRFVEAGFREPDVADPRGTYTHEGLGTGRIGRSGWKLDHVLVRGITDVVQAERILDEPVTIDVRDGNRLRHVPTTLSDHFGVLATVGRAW
jgi:endonuclease/exonuclease/phosphatase family metal-dependent hydrolase